MLQRPFWNGTPTDLGDTWRLRKFENGVQREAVCRLFSHEFGWELRVEVNGDLDYHLVITDDTLQFSPGGGGTQPVPHSFVAEIVNPDCVGGRHGTVTTPQTVYDAFHAQFTNITGGWNEVGGIPVRVTGVAFFDRPHGQTGRAMNGLELHPGSTLTSRQCLRQRPQPAPESGVRIRCAGVDCNRRCDHATSE